MSMSFDIFIRAPPPAPNQEQSSNTSSSTLSSHVTHSVLVAGNQPTMTFAEALQLSQDQNQSIINGSYLGDESYVQWNQPSPPVPTSSGLTYTPP